MQCPSCRFHNMPGLDECGRCGSNLRLATAVLEVNPPRATPWQKRMRRWLPWSRVNRMRHAVREGRISAANYLDVVGCPKPPWPVLARLPVPGWAHFYSGHPLRGRLFLGAFLFFFGFGLLLWGTVPGNLLLGLAFSVHASSAIDILFLVPARLGTRLIATALVMGALGVIVYWPANWLATRIALPLRVQFDSPLFKDGDVLLVNQWSNPHVGNLVLYEGPRVAAGAYIVGGEWIDRIVAGPGDHVIWENQQLIVNGNSSPLSPLNPKRMPDRLEMGEVPAGYYLVFPTAVQMHGGQPNAWVQAMRAMSLVPAHRIHGTVYLRNWPLTRWGPIH